MVPRPVNAVPAILAAASFLALAACGGGETPSSPPASPGPEAQASGVVNLYSTRHYDSDKQLYAAFEAQTGIEVRAREAGAAQLLETMKAEGQNSPADVILAADAGTLWRFKDAGLTRASQSETLNAAIPASLRDEEGHWYGLAKRYRVIVYDPNEVEAGEVDEMADLASDRFDGEVCARSSSNIYNLSLLGEIIERSGAEAAEAWAEGVAGNFARDPEGGDTAQIEAVAAGACSVAIANHYYWVRLAQSGAASDREAAEKTAISFASAGDGVHTNVTAAAVAANAPHPDAARAFIEFLASPEGQAMLVAETREFPVVDGVALPGGLDALEIDQESDLPLSALGENQAEAQMIFDRAGWR